MAANGILNKGVAFAFEIAQRCFSWGVQRHVLCLYLVLGKPFPVLEEHLSPTIV
jgi:hypothetical protein